LDFILEHAPLLEIPEIKALVRMLPFDQKRTWLKNKLNEEKYAIFIDLSNGWLRQYAQTVNLYPIDIIISRESIFTDSCNSFQSANGISIFFFFAKLTDHRYGLKIWTECSIC
jgi:hypothetical protein